jgi:hypothetical protein
MSFMFMVKKKVGCLLVVLPNFLPNNWNRRIHLFVVKIVIMGRATFSDFTADEFSSLL